jgi:hypothetical protein
LIRSGARACGHSVVIRDAEILPLFVRRKNLQKVFLACVVGVTSKQERQQDPKHVTQIVGCALHFSVGESVVKDLSTTDRDLAWQSGGTSRQQLLRRPALGDTQKLAMYTSVEEPLSVCSYKVNRLALHLNAGDEIV